MINKSGIIASSRRNLLFDIQGGAYGAYSLRYLNRGYTGDVILGYHDGTAATQGFTPTEIVDGTLLSWADGDHVRVKTWYDQSGNGNDATQTARYNMPTVVISGVMQFLSGTIPAVDFDGSNDFIPLNSALPDINTGSISSFCVGKFDATAMSALEVMLSLGSTSGNGRLYVPYGYNSEFGWGYAATWNAVTSAADTDPHLFTGIAGSTQGDFQPFIDGTSKGSATLASNATSGTYGIGGLNSTTAYELDGKVAEVIVYSSDQSAKRAALEKNIMDYYSIS
jgi:hypothetical protein